MERREQKPDIECQFCDFTGSFAEGVEHKRSTQHLLRTAIVGEQRRSEAGTIVSPDDRQWSYVETMYAAKVDCGVMEIQPHWTGLLDGEVIRKTIAIVDRHNQHAALVEQRDLLLKTLRYHVSSACHCYQGMVCVNCETKQVIALVEHALATVEQGGES